MTTTKTTIAIWISIILFGLVFGIGLVDVYAEIPTSVEVTGFPFNVSVYEGGSITFNNVLGTKPMEFVDYGWYDKKYVPVGQSLTIQLPITNCGSPPLPSYCFFADVHYTKDLNTGQHNGILNIIKKPVPVVEKPVYVEPTPVYVAPTPIIEKIVEVETDDIKKVAEYQGSVDVKSIQEALTTVTTKFNSSIDVIAKQKVEIKSLQGNLTSLQKVKADTTLLDNKILELQSNNTKLSEEVTSITKDRDGWKKLAESWYGIAMEQLKVMVKVLGL